MAWINSYISNAKRTTSNKQTKEWFYWYFALDFTKFKNFTDFKRKFLKEAKPLAFQSASLVLLEKSAFLPKLKELGGSEKLKNLADSYPFTTYFVRFIL